MKNKRLHQILLCGLACIFCNVIIAQTFTKITEGLLVTNNSQANFCTWGDFDNDGDEDLFITNGWQTPQTNMLFRNMGTENDFEFESVDGAGIGADVSYSMGTSWGDYDNDGDLDLFVANPDWQFHHLYEHEADGTFQRITEGKLVTDLTPYYVWTASWLDYNLDGYLDLFLPDARANSNYLYKGHGNDEFTRIEEGVIPADYDISYWHSWIDFDNDGDPDILVNNTSNPLPFYGLDSLSALYINDGHGNYSKVTTGMILNATNEPLYGGSWVDYDNDGDWDLVHAGTAIYRNEGEENDFQFTKIDTGAIVSGFTNYFPGYSDAGASTWADMDNDGDIDCFVFTVDVSQYASFQILSAVNHLYSNNGDGSFTEIEEGDIVTDETISQSAAWTDYDNDGNMDLYVCNTWNTANNLLYHNDNDNGNSWIKVKLKGTASNASAIGAVIKVKVATVTDPVWQMRAIQGPNNLMAHFGLGTTTTIDSMIVQWPSGHDTVLVDVPVDTLLTITELFPKGYLRANFLADTTLGKHELTVNFTDTSLFDPDNPITSWSWDFNGDGVEDSNVQNPEHTFKSAEEEEYDISLIVSNGISSDTLIMNEMIKVFPLDGNLAPWGIATASSEELPLFYAQKAIDNDPESRWNSDYSDNEWLKVELDSVYTLGKVIIHWESAYAINYSIRVSANDTDWDTVYYTCTGDGDEDILEFTGTEGKYMMIDCIRRGTQWGNSVYELEIYESDGVDYGYHRDFCPDAIENNLVEKIRHIYPNPARDELNIEIDQPIIQNTVVDIIDLTGKLLTRKVVNPGSHAITIDLSGLVKGVYLLKISSDNKVIVEKFIKN